MKILRVFALILILLPFTACQSSFITNLTSASGDRLYWDDFSVTGNWPEHSQPEGSIGYVNGAYNMIITSPKYQLWSVVGKNYRDVQLEVDATRLYGPQANLFGLLCRYQDDKNFYFFIISSDGYYTLGKMLNGEGSLLGQEMMAYNSYILQGENPNHLRFDCTGSTMTGYVNGEMIALSVDTEFEEGDVGLIAGSFEEGSVEVSFDNFAIYKP